MASRNRVIYQSQALYAGLDQDANGDYVDESKAGSMPSVLQRLQSCNYSFDITRQDVNQYGELASIDRVILDAPTVSMDFNYYLGSWANEGIMGFTVNGAASNFQDLESCMGDILGGADERNWYLRVVPEGADAAVTATGVDLGDETIGFGNGFISSYSTEGAIGTFPTSSVNVEALNMRFYDNTYGKSPHVDVDGIANTTSDFHLPVIDVNPGGDTHFNAGSDSTTVMKPGDATVAIQISAAYGAGAVPSDLGAKISDMKIQSYNFSMDMTREALQKLGSKFAYAREITFPVNVTASVDAICGEVEAANLVSIVDDDRDYDMIVDLKKGTTKHMAIIMKKAKLDGTSFTNSIGDNKSLTMNFSTQVGSATQSGVGLFFSGKS
jgi:hypothetical protein